MQIDPHRRGGQAGSRGDLRPGHPLDEPQNQRLAIGLGQRVDDRQELARRRRVRVWRRARPDRPAAPLSSPRSGGENRWRGCAQWSTANRRTPPVRAARQAGSRRSGRRPGPDRRRRRAARATGAARESCGRSARTARQTPSCHRPAPPARACRRRRRGMWRTAPASCQPHCRPGRQQADENSCCQGRRQKCLLPSALWVSRFPAPTRHPLVPAARVSDQDEAGARSVNGLEQSAAKPMI